VEKAHLLSFKVKSKLHLLWEAVDWSLYFAWTPRFPLDLTQLYDLLSERRDYARFTGTLPFPKASWA
jgi:hypothetical protein